MSISVAENFPANLGSIPGADWSRFMQQVGTLVPVLVESKAVPNRSARGEGRPRKIKHLVDLLEKGGVPVSCQVSWRT